jgi:hypothetical protein
MTYAMAKCRQGCCVRLALNDSRGKVPVHYVLPDGRPFVEMEEIQKAIPYLVWCRVHRSPMRGKPLRATRTDKPCNAACMRSASADCRCSCAGSNHGIYA